MQQNMWAYQTITNKDTLGTYYKCTLSTITDKSNVSRYMLIRIYFLVLECKTHALGLSTPFTCTLYMVGQKWHTCWPNFRQVHYMCRIWVCGLEYHSNSVSCVRHLRTQNRRNIPLVHTNTHTTNTTHAHTHTKHNIKSIHLSIVSKLWPNSFTSKGMLVSISPNTNHSKVTEFPIVLFQMFRTLHLYKEFNSTCSTFTGNMLLLTQYSNSATLKMGQFHK
jgi:hypothetical protein